MPAKSRRFLVRTAGSRSLIPPHGPPASAGQAGRRFRDQQVPRDRGRLRAARARRGDAFVLQGVCSRTERSGPSRPAKPNRRRGTRSKGKSWNSPRFPKNRGPFISFSRKTSRGRHTRFRIVNEAAKMDSTGLKKADLDDAEADPASPSDRQGYFERHYRKSEHRIPMRDGVRLFTQVYSPIDASEPHPDHPLPDALRDLALRRGLPEHDHSPRSSSPRRDYIIVFQDIRGTSMSEGTFEYITPYIHGQEDRGRRRREQRRLRHDRMAAEERPRPQRQGRGLGQSPIAGFTAAMAAISAHPAVRAVSPQAPMADLFLGDDGHHNGALYLAHYANYLYSMGQPRKGPATDPRPQASLSHAGRVCASSSGSGPLKNIDREGLRRATTSPWDDVMAHETYDAYWQAHSIYPHLRDIKPAILTVGGWYDAEDLLGTLRTYQTIEERNPGLSEHARHGSLGATADGICFGGRDGGPGRLSPSAERGPTFMEKIELPFFNHYLKGGGPLDIPEAVVFETGTDQWRTYDSLAARGSEGAEAVLRRTAAALAFDQAAGPSGDRNFDEYVSDPAKPVPYTTQTTATYYRDYFVEDQRFAASRPDVLVYLQRAARRGPRRSRDRSRPSSTSRPPGTDADWVVKVIDVYPDDAPDPRTESRGASAWAATSG
ncbi:MAG: CocE/NonD family hydrolase [Sphingobacterium sp.]|nr:CocE/NonD family hydrolase [Sphingobacterium sp.]